MVRLRLAQALEELFGHGQFQRQFLGRDLADGRRVQFAHVAHVVALHLRERQSKHGRFLG